MKKQFETYRDFGSYEINNFTQKEPSCFNGMVRVVKYRVTIEQVDEPEEVIRERIKKLWDECTNHHHREPLIQMGMKYGIDLRGVSRNSG